MFTYIVADNFPEF